MIHDDQEPIGDMRDDGHETERRGIERRLEQVETESKEHGYALQRVELEQKHQKEMTRTQYDALQAGQSTISNQLSGLTTTVNLLNEMKNEIHGGMWIARALFLSGGLALLFAFVKSVFFAGK